jgi:hypothetical protein
MQAFLKAKGVEGLNLDDLDQLEKAAGELAECLTRMSALAEKRRAVEQELSDNDRHAAELSAMIPEYERLQTHRSDVAASIRELEEKLSNITYLSGALKNDLRQIEHAGGSSDKGPFGTKQLVLSLGAAGVGLFVAMLWIVALELAFGKVRGGREIEAYPAISFIGSLPIPGALPEDEDREVMGVVALKMLLAADKNSIVLLCRLPGAEMREDFASVVDSTALMSGVDSFLLDVVSSANFAPPKDAEQMVGVVRSGAHGWFPTANRFAMAPTELQILQADLAELKNSYGNIFVRMEGGVRTGGTFFDQLLGLCDAVMLMIGADKTPRSAFGYVRRHVANSGKAIMAMATGGDVKTVRREMETRL